MHRFKNRSLYLILAPLLFAGCASTSVTVPELATAHPASPDAPAAPIMSMSQTLKSSGISSTPSDDQPAAGMEGMDHGAMNETDQTKSSEKTQAKEPMKTMEKDSMEGMDHGSMQGMDGMNQGAASPQKEGGP